MSNFYKSSGMYACGGKLGSYDVYSWESKDELTDIRVYDNGAVELLVNCRPVYQITRRHKRIAKEFNLGGINNDH